MPGVGQCSIWQGTLDSGPVSEYGVTFFRRNDGLRRDCPGCWDKARAGRRGNMLGFLFSPFRALSKGCLFGIGGCFGVIIALIIIGILLGLASDFLVCR